MSILYRKLLLAKSILFQLEAFHTSCYQGNIINWVSKLLWSKVVLKEKLPVSKWHMCNMYCWWWHWISGIIPCNLSQQFRKLYQLYTSDELFISSMLKTPKLPKNRADCLLPKRLGYLSCYWFMTLLRYKNRTG